MKRYAHGLYWERVGSKNMWVARDVRFQVLGLSYDTIVLAREGTVHGHNVYAFPYMWSDWYEDVSATTYRHITHFLGYRLGKRNRCKGGVDGEVYTVNGDVWMNVEAFAGIEQAR